MRSLSVFAPGWLSNQCIRLGPSYSRCEERARSDNLRLESHVAPGVLREGRTNKVRQSRDENRGKHENSAHSHHFFSDRIWAAPPQQCFLVHL